jgi:multidrug efflux system membrane fusion protein
LLEKSKLKIKAPFSGVIEEVQMEIGQFVTPGSVCATLVDLDPMLLVGEVSEHQIAGLKPKLPVTARLSDGRSILGEVRFVSQLANRGTRTYSLEAELPNIDGSIKGGLTAAIDIVTGSNKAHRISAALLVLDDEGNTGVRTVSEAGVVVFYQVDLISESSDGVWVAGLPEVVDLIVVGQQTVVAGERVEAKRISMDLTNAISQGVKQR